MKEGIWDVFLKENDFGIEYIVIKGVGSWWLGE